MPCRSFYNSQVFVKRNTPPESSKGDLYICQTKTNECAFSSGHHCDECHGTLGGDLVPVKPPRLGPSGSDGSPVGRLDARNFLPALMPIVSQIQVIYAALTQRLEELVYVREMLCIGR